MNHVIRIIAATLGSHRPFVERSSAGSGHSEIRPHGGANGLACAPWEGLYLEETA